VLGPVEKRLGRRALEHLAVVHEEHAVGHLAREAHLVRHADHRHAVLRERAHRSGR
jgi:hypothetical protein